MKRALAILLVTIMLFSLVACDNGNQITNHGTEYSPTSNATESNQVSSCRHVWRAATCTAPKTCTLCGLVDGDTKAHSYENGKCKKCGTSDPNYVTKPTQPPKKTYYCKICNKVVVSSNGDVCKECRCPACGAYNYPYYDGFGVRRPFCQNCNCRYYGCYLPVMRAGGFWCELHGCHKQGCSKQAEKNSLYCINHQP